MNSARLSLVFSEYYYEFDKVLHKMIKTKKYYEHYNLV